MEFQHINPQEAVEIHEDIKSNFSLGIHWGTFNLSYEVSPRGGLPYKIDRGACHTFFKNILKR